jgi:hypothetical protein
MSDDEIIRMANEAGWGYEDVTRATAELRERIRVLENDAAGEAVVFDTIVAQRDEARAEAERLRAALEKLARLGNGQDYGNSKGNMIAQAALKEPK